MFSQRERNFLVCEVEGVLANARVVIISQYISVSNQRVVHLNFTQC